MEDAISHYYLKQEEPIKGCLLALRTIIISHDPHITAIWQYGMPFFCYKGKRFCYLWVHKKYHQPYLGIVDGNRIDHPDLITEKRAKMKIMLIDPNKDIPVQTLNYILTQVLALYNQ